MAAVAMSGTATIAVARLPVAGMGGVEFGERERSPCPILAICRSLGRWHEDIAVRHPKLLKSLLKLILPKGSAAEAQTRKLKEQNLPVGTGTPKRKGEFASLAEPEAGSSPSTIQVRAALCAARSTESELLPRSTTSQ